MKRKKKNIGLVIGKKDINSLITEKPAFSALLQLANGAEGLSELIEGLADEDGDTVQRATDLLVGAENFLQLVRSVVVEEE